MTDDKLRTERCFLCDEPTEKAGPGDGSLYSDDVGPFCRRCYGLISPIIDRMEKAEGNFDRVIRELAKCSAWSGKHQAEIDSLKRQLAEAMRERDEAHGVGAWGRFLKARLECIDEWDKEGQHAAQIRETLTPDVGQIYLLVQTAREKRTMPRPTEESAAHEESD